jgi:hypothetical protein
MQAKGMGDNRIKVIFSREKLMRWFYKPPICPKNQKHARERRLLTGTATEG